MTKVCTILVGPPGAGKSTWLDLNWGDTVKGKVASSDKIIDTVASMYGYSYNEAFQELIKFADRVFWDRLATWSKTGSDIVIDRTNMSAKGRSRYFDLLGREGYVFDAVVFPTPDKEEWTRRLDRPGKSIPQNVIQSMLASFVMPTEAEGFRNIFVIEP